MSSTFDMLNGMMEETAETPVATENSEKSDAVKSVKVVAVKDDPKFAELEVKVPLVGAGLEAVTISLGEIFSDLLENVSVRVDLSVAVNKGVATGVAKIKRSDIKTPKCVDWSGAEISVDDFKTFEKRTYTKRDAS